MALCEEHMEELLLFVFPVAFGVGFWMSTTSRDREPVLDGVVEEVALRERVRTSYAQAALRVTTGEAGCGCGQPADCGCDDGCCATANPAGFGAELYGEIDR
jgi:hypothetical protein